MSSERRTIEGEVPDGIADRTQGNTYNPNPADELAEQRARFAENQQQLQQERAEAAEAVSEVQQDLGAQYQAAQADPAHQAFVPTQQAELEHEPMQTQGGQFDTSGANMPETIGGGESMRRVSTPVPPSSGALPNDDRPTGR